MGNICQCRHCLCNPDVIFLEWSRQVPAEEVPCIGVAAQDSVTSNVHQWTTVFEYRATTPQARSSSNLTSAATDSMATNLAKHGSNFGLPIALHLVQLMGGSIGIVEVQ